ncbi:MAG: PEP-CTERM sorting domain-containing protein, partial [Planctomycetota bacterium]
TAAFDGTWQFVDFGAEMLPPTINNVTGGFGLGTVGNGAVDNNFNGSVVGTVDYSIYAPPIDTANLNNVELVRDSATFTFTGVSGYTEADIVDLYAFGLGTAPDSLLIPEPATMALLGMGSLLLIRKKQE